MRYCTIGKRGLAVFCALLCAGLLVAGLYGRMGAAAQAAAQKRLVPIYCVDTQEKAVAIGFNCAWGDADIPLLLDTLEQQRVKATFFVVGQWAEEHPDSVRAIAQAGHEMGNHSYSHPDMTALSREEIRAQVKRCNDVVERIAGVRVTLFRAPSGAYNNAVVEEARRLGCDVIQWNLDSRDWKNPSAQEMVKNVMGHLEPGSILLFHVGKENTDKAMPELLRQIKEQGYTLLPVGELIYHGEYRVDGTGKQFPA